MNVQLRAALHGLQYLPAPTQGETASEYRERLQRIATAPEPIPEQHKPDGAAWKVGPPPSSPWWAYRVRSIGELSEGLRVWRQDEQWRTLGGGTVNEWPRNCEHRIDPAHDRPEPAWQSTQPPRVKCRWRDVHNGEGTATPDAAGWCLEVDSCPSSFEVFPGLPKGWQWQPLPADPERPTRGTPAHGGYPTPPKPGPVRYKVPTSIPRDGAIIIDVAAIDAAMAKQPAWSPRGCDLPSPHSQREFIEMAGTSTVKGVEFVHIDEHERVEREREYFRRVSWLHIQGRPLPEPDSPLYNKAKAHLDEVKGAAAMAHEFARERDEAREALARFRVWALMLSPLMVAEASDITLRAAVERAFREAATDHERELSSVKRKLTTWRNAGRVLAGLGDGVDDNAVRERLADLLTVGEHGCKEGEKKHLRLDEWRTRTAALANRYPEDFSEDTDGDAALWLAVLHRLTNDSRAPVRALLALAMGLEPAYRSLSTLLDLFAEMAAEARKVGSGAPADRPPWGVHLTAPDGVYALPLGWEAEYVAGEEGVVEVTFAAETFRLVREVKP